MCSYFDHFVNINYINTPFCSKVEQKFFKTVFIWKMHLISNIVKYYDNLKQVEFVNKALI